EHLKLGIVELGDVLNALLNVGVQRRILLLEQPKIVLVDDTHVDILEKQHIVHVLKSADAKHWQDANPLGPQIVHDVPDVLGEPRARTRDTGHHDGYRDIVGLALFLIVAEPRSRFLVVSQSRTQGGGQEGNRQQVRQVQEETSSSRTESADT